MKKHAFITVIILGSFLSNAQTSEVLDTIYTNNQKNVALFFPDPITQGITGSENFVFTYNREKQQNFGLLQATPGSESNLLVICANGSIYSYILKFKKQLHKYHYFVNESEGIGNVRPVDSLVPVKPEKELITREKDYKEFCSFLLRKKQQIGRIKYKNHGIVLSIENIVFHSSELYFVIKLENRSSLDYDINFLNLSILTRQKGERKSTQTLLKEPIFKYKLPAKIKQGHTKELVYVLPKFSISKDRRLVFELNEKDGERNIELKVSHRFINNPN